MISATDDLPADDSGRDDPVGAIAQTECRGPRRFRFRLGTLLLVIAILALLLVVVVQQVQLERMRRLVMAQQSQIKSQIIRHGKDRDLLTEQIRFWRDMAERDARRSGGKSSRGEAPEARGHR
jgi:hypothetical protein